MRSVSLDVVVYRLQVFHAHVFLLPHWVPSTWHRCIHSGITSCVRHYAGWYPRKTIVSLHYDICTQLRHHPNHSIFHSLDSPNRNADLYIPKKIHSRTANTQESPMSHNRSEPWLPIQFSRNWRWTDQFGCAPLLFQHGYQNRSSQQSLHYPLQPSRQFDLNYHDRYHSRIGTHIASTDDWRGHLGRHLWQTDFKED